MDCPPEVCKPILEILRTGLARIRTFGHTGDSQRCFVESDHLHNLPGILISYSIGAINYYITVEKKIFLGNSAGTSTSDFENSWCEIQKYLDQSAQIRD